MRFKRGATALALLSVVAAGAYAGRALSQSGATAPLVPAQADGLAPDPASSLPSDAPLPLPTASARAEIPEPAAGKIPAPPPGSFYLGVYREQIAYRAGALDELKRDIGALPALSMWYQEWAGGPAFPIDEARRLQRLGTVPVVSWEPWKPPDVFGRLDVSQPAFRLSRIAGGAFDRYIRAYAEGIREYGGPVMLRPLHEMDGFWYPWGGTVNGNTPADFVAAWRRIHGIFQQVGTPNVTWVWSVNHVSVPSTPANSFDKYWPGGRYVDWIGISGFNWGNAVDLSVWSGIDRVIKARYDALVPYRRPIALMETGAPETGGNKAAWIADTMRGLRERYPQLRAVIWYDRKDSPSRDWRITSSTSARASFRRAIEHSAILKANDAYRMSIRNGTRFRFTDDFERVGIGWADPRSEGWLTIPAPGTQVSLFVNGDLGRARADPEGPAVIALGPDTARNLEATAAFDVAPEATAALALRVLGRGSHYALRAVPRGDGFDLSILRSRDWSDRVLGTARIAGRLAAQEELRMRARVEDSVAGVTLRLRVWPASTPEPEDWHLEAVDGSPQQLMFGRAGLRVEAGGSIGVDDFEAGTS